MAQLSAGFGYEYYTAPRRVSVAPKKIQSLDDFQEVSVKLSRTMHVILKKIHRTVLKKMKLLIMSNVLNSLKTYMRSVQKFQSL